nr:MAG TPA: hypothetical protein [Caudoviricetes sp.]
MSLYQTNLYPYSSPPIFLIIPQSRKRRKAVSRK